MTLLGAEPALLQVKNQVARILLNHIENNGDGNHRLTQREMAECLGTGWDSIHLALKSLVHDGTIKVEHNRIILNKELIQKAAGAA